MIHENQSELAGKVVKIKEDVEHFQFPDFGGSEYRVEDWQDRIIGKSWMDSEAEGNPACIVYALRVVENNLPIDNEVLYGKVGPFGHLVHISEIERK